MIDIFNFLDFSIIISGLNDIINGDMLSFWHIGLDPDHHPSPSHTLTLSPNSA